MKKKPLCNFFKLNVLGRKGLSPRRKQNGSPNHVPLGRKKLTYPKEQFLLGERGLSSPREQLPPRDKWIKFLRRATWNNFPRGTTSRMFDKKSSSRKCCPNETFVIPLERS
jgi:hypothetical protein